MFVYLGIFVGVFEQRAAVFAVLIGDLEADRVNPAATG